jgi:hypothetical protein
MLQPLRVRGTVAIAVFLACSHVGCAPKLRAMDPTRPVETERGYRQQGEPIDRTDMLDKLSKEPAASSHVARARLVGTVGIILLAAGNALIGYPLGEYSADADPHWNMAYAGGAAAIAGVPFIIWSADSISSAVEAHNRTIAARSVPPGIRGSKPAAGDTTRRSVGPRATPVGGELDGQSIRATPVEGR